MPGGVTGKAREGIPMSIYPLSSLKKSSHAILLVVSKLFVPLLPMKLYPALSSKATKNSDARPDLAEWAQYG